MVITVFIEVDNDISSRKMRTMRSTARKHEQSVSMFRVAEKERADRISVTVRDEHS